MRVAQAAAATGPTGDTGPTRLRVALSPAARERLNGSHVLRLLELELYDVAPLEAGLDGPLEVDVIRVWIDVPGPERALIEVGRPGRPVTRRALSLRETPGDVAALVVMVAASELVRAQAEPQQAPEPEPGPPATEPGEPDMLRGLPLALDAAMAGMYVHGSDTVATGGELGLTHRRGITGQSLYARWLLAPGSDLRLRWLEVGAAADLRVPLGDTHWRLRLAARAGGAAVQVLDATSVDGISAQTTSWSARAGALLGIERHLVDATWLSLAVEPGGTLRTVRGERASGPFELGGFALAFQLGLTLDPSVRTPLPVPVTVGAPR